jgi:hypothetical protein
MSKLLNEVLAEAGVVFKKRPGVDAVQPRREFPSLHRFGSQEQCEDGEPCAKRRQTQASSAEEVAPLRMPFDEMFHGQTGTSELPPALETDFSMAGFEPDSMRDDQAVAHCSQPTLMSQPLPRVVSSPEGRSTYNFSMFNSNDWEALLPGPGRVSQPMDSPELWSEILRDFGSNI